MGQTRIDALCAFNKISILSADQFGHHAGLYSALNTQGKQWRTGSPLGRQSITNRLRRSTRGKVHANGPKQNARPPWANGLGPPTIGTNSYACQTPHYEWISPFDLSGFSGLPLNGFTYYWTLSSKCFSTFPHGTCSLSVSWSYLALDGVYHPLRAALSSNPTLRRDSPKTDSGPLRAWHPLWAIASFKKDLDAPYCLRINESSLTLHFPVSGSPATGFSAGLFPVRSQLLRES